jgi:hypothetical protein
MRQMNHVDIHLRIPILKIINKRRLLAQIIKSEDRGVLDVKRDKVPHSANCQ